MQSFDHIKREVRVLEHIECILYASKFLPIHIIQGWLYAWVAKAVQCIGLYDCEIPKGWYKHINFEKHFEERKSSLPWKTRSTNKGSSLPKHWLWLYLDGCSEDNLICN